MKRGLSKGIIVLAALLAAFFVTSWVASTLRQEVQRFVVGSIDDLQAIVEQATGLRLRYAWLSIEKLNTLVIHEVRLEQPSTVESSGTSIQSADTADAVTRRTPVTIDRVAIRLSYWAAIMGHGTDIIRDVKADKLSFDLQWPEEDYVLIKLYKFLFEGPAITLPRFQLTIEPVHLNIRKSGANTLLAGVSIKTLQLSTLAGFPEIAAPLVAIESHGFMGLPPDAQAQLSVWGKLAADFSSFSFNIGVRAKSPDFSLAYQELAVWGAGGRIEGELRKAGVEVRGWYEGGRWGLEGA
ncbi:MAG: hypothetical protein WHT81_00095, partial [Rectinemataceae bacterium]